MEMGSGFSALSPLQGALYASAALFSLQSIQSHPETTRDSLAFSQAEK